MRDRILGLEDFKRSESQKRRCDTHDNRALFLLCVSVIELVTNDLCIVRHNERGCSCRRHTQVEHGLRGEELSDGRPQDSTSIRCTRVRRQARTFELKVKKSALGTEFTLTDLLDVAQRNSSSIAKLA